MECNTAKFGIKQQVNSGPRSRASHGLAGNARARLSALEWDCLSLSCGISHRQMLGVGHSGYGDWEAIWMSALCDNFWHSEVFENKASEDFPGIGQRLDSGGILFALSP